MRVVGAIDIGSNAVRMSCVALTEDQRIEPIESARTAIRLGQEVFHEGAVSEQTLEKLLEAFKIYARIFKQNRCEEIRAYATSALREAKNQEEVIARLQQETGIEPTVISGVKEGDLLKRAIQTLINLEHGTHMLVDLGGGSVEITLLRQGEVLFAESFRVGTVRLLQIFPYDPLQEKEFVLWAKSYIRDFFQNLEERLKEYSVTQFIVTGGNATAIAQLGKRFNGGKSKISSGVSFLHKSDFKMVQKELLKRNLQERIEELQLPTDRADVILPALYVFKYLLRISQCSGLTIPDVGLREGILQEILEGQFPAKALTEYQQIIQSAFYYTQRYRANLAHAKTVRKLSAQIFAGTFALHHYGQRERVYLETSAILHDIGRFISPANHHKHSMYLIQNIELVGLTQAERKIISLICRYHHRGLPTQKHSDYASLSEANQKLVNSLAGMLRIADALDRDHQSSVDSITVHYDAKKVMLFLETAHDLLLTQWALGKKKNLFEQFFGRTLEIEYHPDALKSADSSQEELFPSLVLENH